MQSRFAAAFKACMYAAEQCKADWTPSALASEHRQEHSWRGKAHRKFLQHPIDCVLCMHDRQLTPLHAAGKTQHLSAVPGAN